MLNPEDTPLMIDNWRRLAELYRKAGNPVGAERTTRLADQLEQMVSNETITYSTDPRKHEAEQKLSRYCRRCLKTLPISSFGRDANLRYGFTRYCLPCNVKPPAAKKPYKKRAKKVCDLTVSVNTGIQETQNEA